MFTQWQELRRREEGYALVLAGVFLLVLALGVLATAQLSQVVEQKIRLQNALDAAAYNIAAHEARVLNFLATTNRAMVVHHVAQLTLVSLVSYLSFLLLTTTALGFLPYLGPSVFQPLRQALQAIVTGLDKAVAAAVPAIDLLNHGLAVAQQAAVAGLVTKLTTDLNGYVSQASPEGARIPPAMAAILGPATAQAFASTVVTGLDEPEETERSFHRRLMTEVVNSGRHPWTAYGGANGSGLPLIPRRAHIGGGLGPFQFLMGKFGRSEWGTIRSGRAIHQQLFARDELRLELTIFGYGLRMGTSAWARMDDRDRAPAHGASVSLDVCPDTIAGLSCRLRMEEITRKLSEGLSHAMKAATIPNDGAHRHAGLVPYARFRPGRADWKQPRADELFQQPSVLLMATLPVEKIFRSGTPFLRAVQLTPHTASAKGGASSVRVQFRTPETLAGLPAGLHAVSAAMAVYHRPGDWREPPNLFNPFWGARLMPVADSPLLSRTPLLGQLLPDGIVVH